MDLFILLQVSATEDLKVVFILATLAFLLTPLFLLLYIHSYNTRKKSHAEEKKRMAIAFEAEILMARLETQEHTMQTIATELHDNIGQLLGLSALTLGSIDVADPQKTAVKVSDVRELNSKAIAELRQLAKLMQGERMMGEGLDVVIQAELDYLIRTGHYTATFINRYGNLSGVDARKQLFLFRMVQEAINNAVKHAKASHLLVVLKAVEGQLELSITDNGDGFDVSKALGQGMGLYTMKRRAELIDGEVEICAVSGEGTKILIRIEP